MIRTTHEAGIIELPFRQAYASKSIRQNNASILRWQDFFYFSPRKLLF